MVTSKSKKVVLGAVALTAIVTGIVFVREWLFHNQTPSTTVTLYGNVDIRQVNLAFNDSDRIDKLLVDEGTAVHVGQLVAQLSPQRFRDAVARAQANVATQQQVVARLLAGSRPEEIAAARADVGAAQADVGYAQADVGAAQADIGAAQADVDAAQANLTNARLLYQRQQTLAGKQYVSLQVKDDAHRGLLAAQAELAGKRQTLAAKRKALAAKQQAVAAKQHALAARQQVLQLAVAGPRKEDIAAAQATLRSDVAALALAQRELADTQLYAPADGVIQERILEPGDMATPQTPVYTLALDNPLWVRAYLPEPEMGKVALGMRAWIETDSFPGQRFPGWIGFISPVAEFTPKNVETTQLRSQLVYRVRVYACNPDHRLRLGMPATVGIALVDNPPHAIPARPCGTN
jgi:multidrug resistance efflux pump